MLQNKFAEHILCFHIHCRATTSLRYPKSKISCLYASNCSENCKQKNVDYELQLFWVSNFVYLFNQTFWILNLNVYVQQLVSGLFPLKPDCGNQILCNCTYDVFFQLQM